MVEKEKTIFDYILLASVDINPLSDFLDNPEVDLNVKDRNGNSPFYIAIINNRIVAIEMMLEHIVKYNKNIYDYLKFRNFNLIEMLVLRSDFDIFEKFLKFGLDINYKIDKLGNTFLHRILCFPSTNIRALNYDIHLFAKYNGDFTIKNNNGESCIELFLRKFNNQPSNNNKIFYEDRFVFESELNDLKAIMKMLLPLINNNRYLIPANVLLSFRKTLSDVFSNIQTRKNLDIVNLNNILNELED